MLAASIGQGNGVTTVATPFQYPCHHCNTVSVVRKIASEQFGRRSCACGQVREHPASVRDCDVELVALEETRISRQPLDLAIKFSLALWLEVNAALVRFEDDLRFALAH
jgi:hypothetical protein